MKKVLLGLLLGITLLKTSEIAYTYYWWEYEKSCRMKDAPVEKELECIYDKMGAVEYLRFVNINYVREFNYWKWEY